MRIKNLILFSSVCLNFLSSPSHSIDSFEEGDKNITRSPMRNPQKNELENSASLNLSWNISSVLQSVEKFVEVMLEGVTVFREVFCCCSGNQSPSYSQTPETRATHPLLITGNELPANKGTILKEREKLSCEETEAGVGSKCIAIPKPDLPEVKEEQKNITNTNPQIIECKEKVKVEIRNQAFPNECHIFKLSSKSGPKEIYEAVDKWIDEGDENRRKIWGKSGGGYLSPNEYLSTLIRRDDSVTLEVTADDGEKQKNFFFYYRPSQAS